MRIFARCSAVGVSFVQTGHDCIIDAADKGTSSVCGGASGARQQQMGSDRPTDRVCFYSLFFALDDSFPLRSLATPCQRTAAAVCGNFFLYCRITTCHGQNDEKTADAKCACKQFVNKNPLALLSPQTHTSSVALHYNGVIKHS